MMEILTQCLYTLAASVAFAVIFNIKKVNIIIAAIGGVLCQAVFMTLEGFFASVMPVYFISAAAITVYSEIMAARMKEPVPVYLVVSFIPLVPGSEIYFAMTSSFTGDTDTFITKMLHTLAIAGSIAMGVLIVTSLIKIFKQVSYRIKKSRARI